MGPIAGADFAVEAGGDRCLSAPWKFGWRDAAVVSDAKIACTPDFPVRAADGDGRKDQYKAGQEGEGECQVLVHDPILPDTGSPHLPRFEALAAAE
jgi:hypothetical protein